VAVTGKPVEVIGLVELVKDLKGPLWRDTNNQLRYEALEIAKTVEPAVRAVVASSRAPQAAAFVPTVKAKRDRVPLVAIGATNPKLKKFTRRGAGPEASRRRRGSMAHGILFGPAGGHRQDGAGRAKGANFYRIGRDETFLARALRDNGPVLDAATQAYLEAFQHVMERNGWPGKAMRRGR
jgi:hypothetical protein